MASWTRGVSGSLFILGLIIGIGGFLAAGSWLMAIAIYTEVTNE